MSEDEQMIRPLIVALFGAIGLAACAAPGDVVSSRNVVSPVFIPAFDAPVTP